MTLGVHQSFGGVARMIGPLWAGIAFEHVGIRSPFWIAARVMLFVRLFASIVREEDDEVDGNDGAVDAPIASAAP